MFSCDYNGWADVPEEEREGIDAFEAGGPPNTYSVPNPTVEPRFRQVVRSYDRHTLPQRRAA